ncbi:hypothetical protein QQS21_003400 [Conoideocrella luteorostrata]|uniref:PIPK domain-containing protein n=1 Tax=Conoideocrella luteorostrata TaxID=1105319 RepID=A0AAJ0G0N3_9HYPO|nr:hypothetical protein QQS21_003400 [Conoideocrella luteorostrata]
MGAHTRRSAAITRAISRGLDGENEHAEQGKWSRAVKRVIEFFSIFHLDLDRYRGDDFYALRHDFWDLDEDEYIESFRSRAGDDARDAGQQSDERLIPAGNLGYSGSTFFHTSNSKYLVKSLDRSFENEFFMHELFEPYAAYIKSHPNSLLNRITDTMYAPRSTLGSIFGIQPRHYIIMENLLHGQDGGEDGARWETYDLKPDDYFFPERDIAEGRLAPDSVKDRLIDQFNDELRVPADMKQLLTDICTEDTSFLASSNVVDFSLFLARYPIYATDDSAAETSSIAASAKQSPSWRTGVLSTDGKWVYRAVLLDFLWAKHKLHPKFMSGLIGAFNIFFKKGPMTITTEPLEYSGRFMRMVDQLLKEGDEGREAGTSAG